MPEKIIGKLCRFGGILGFSGERVCLDEGVVQSVIAHIPAIQRVQGDVVTYGDVLEPLGEGELQVERQHFADARRIGFQLHADVFGQQGEGEIFVLVVVASGHIHRDAGGEIRFIEAENRFEVGADGEVGGEFPAPADNQRIVAGGEFPGFVAVLVRPAEGAVVEPVDAEGEAARFREGVGVSCGNGGAFGEIVREVKSEVVMVPFADKRGVDQHERRVVIMNRNQVVTQAHHSGGITEIQEVIDKLPSRLRLELRHCGQQEQNPYKRMSVHKYQTAKITILCFAMGDFMVFKNF